MTASTRAGIPEQGHTRLFHVLDTIFIGGREFMAKKESTLLDEDRNFW